MIALGIDSGFVDLIMRCVSLVTYSFVINGRKMGCIKPSRGLRQGDPLSPYLFLLCAEGLTRILGWLEMEGRIHGIKVARACPSIYHLFFADDCLLFFRAKENEAGLIARSLAAFARLTGQEINYTKS